MRAKRKRKRRRMVPFPLLLDPSWLPRIERVAEAYRERLPGARITLGEACRAAIKVGLDAIERQLGLGARDEGLARSEEPVDRGK